MNNRGRPRDICATALEKAPGCSIHCKPLCPHKSLGRVILVLRPEVKVQQTGDWCPHRFEKEISRGLNTQTLRTDYLSSYPPLHMWAQLPHLQNDTSNGYYHLTSVAMKHVHMCKTPSTHPEIITSEWGFPKGRVSRVHLFWSVYTSKLETARTMYFCARPLGHPHSPEATWRATYLVPVRLGRHPPDPDPSLLTLSSVPLIHKTEQSSTLSYLPNLYFTSLNLIFFPTPGWFK